MLARAIKDGRMLEEVRPNFDEDDDRVVLVLGAIDAASEISAPCSADVDQG